MFYSELNRSQKDRLKRYGYCKICNKPINMEDELLFNKIQVGRYIKYEFYHKKCIKSSS